MCGLSPTTIDLPRDFPGSLLGYTVEDTIWTRPAQGPTTTMAPNEGQQPEAVECGSLSGGHRSGRSTCLPPRPLSSRGAAHERGERVVVRVEDRSKELDIPSDAVHGLETGRTGGRPSGGSIHQISLGDLSTVGSTLSTARVTTGE